MKFPNNNQSQILSKALNDIDIFIKLPNMHLFLAIKKTIIGHIKVICQNWLKKTSGHTKIKISKLRGKLIKWSLFLYTTRFLLYY